MIDHAGAARNLRLPRKGGLALLLYLLSTLWLSLGAQETLPPRLQIGINMLPAIIAANKGLTTLEDYSRLPIYLVYRNNSHNAALLAQGLGRIDQIRTHALDVQTMRLDDLLRLDPAPHGTIFIAEPLDSRLPELIGFAQRHRALLFSPFEGDVSLGVTTGFRVTDRVLPLVNTESLKLSKIQLKAFFLRIAVKHE